MVWRCTQQWNGGLACVGAAFLRWRGGVCAVAGRPASGQAPSWRELVRRRQSECSQTGSRRLFSMRNEMMSRRAERSNEAKESSRAVGGADDREKCQWQSGCPCTAADGNCSMRRACRVKAISLSSGRVSAKRIHTTAERSQKRWQPAERERRWAIWCVCYALR